MWTLVVHGSRHFGSTRKNTPTDAVRHTTKTQQSVEEGLLGSFGASLLGV